MPVDSSQALEAALFLQGESIPYQKLETLLAIGSEELASAKTKLSEKLQASESALTLLDNGDSLQLGIVPACEGVAQKLVRGEYNDELTDTQLEVLTIVAYRGPVTRPAIDSIRGVNSSYTVRNLLIRGLLERAGNQEDARGYLYRLSNDFLATLGISKPEELPEYETLSVDTRFQEDAFTQISESPYEE